MTGQPGQGGASAPGPDSGALVGCTICGAVYEEGEVKWDEGAKMLVCRDWPQCDGAGAGYDLIPLASDEEVDSFQQEYGKTLG